MNAQIPVYPCHPLPEVLLPRVDVLVQSGLNVLDVEAYDSAILVRGYVSALTGRVSARAEYTPAIALLLPMPIGRRHSPGRGQSRGEGAQRSS